MFMLLNHMQHNASNSDDNFYNYNLFLSSIFYFKIDAILRWAEHRQTLTVCALDADSLCSTNLNHEQKEATCCGLQITTCLAHISHKRKIAVFFALCQRLLIT